METGRWTEPWTMVPAPEVCWWTSPFAPACCWHIPVRMRSSTGVLDALSASLRSGDLLVLRDVVVEAGGMKTIQAVLVHPDGSGVAAEAGNWLLAALADETSLSEGGLPMPRVTRPDPVYSIAQLGRLVQAVDESVRRCLNAGCKRNQQASADPSRS